jgi:hypothetical protein
LRNCFGEIAITNRRIRAGDITVGRLTGRARDLSVTGVDRRTVLDDESTARRLGGIRSGQRRIDRCSDRRSVHRRAALI